MKQPKRGWISPIRIKPSFHHMICFVIVTTFIVPTVPDVKAQSRYIASPACWFVDRKKVDDILAPDYVVEFEIPMGATNIWAYTTTAGIESRVLGFSTTYDHWATRNGKNVVRVVTGYRARKCTSSYNPAARTCNYTGSIDQWARSLRIRYYR